MRAPTSPLWIQTTWKCPLAFRNGAEDNDVLTYDTRTVGFQSNAFREAQYRGERAQKLAATSYGNTKAGLAYTMDQWRDKRNQARCSIQIRLPSDTDFVKSVISRLSSSQQEFVMLFPMNKYMARADFAFGMFFLDAKQVLEIDEKAILYLRDTRRVLLACRHSSRLLYAAA
jgi:hypothetical protein